MSTLTTPTTNTNTINLSPDAPNFCPATKVNNSRFDIQYALSLTSHFLSTPDFCMLTEIVSEWSSLPTLSSIFKHWKSFSNTCTPAKSSSFIHALLFNVRGLAERWEEVLLLVDKYKVDILVLTESGRFDRDLVRQCFMNYRSFYMEGENSWGGVILLIKKGIPVSRVKCDIPNVVCVDIKFERTVRVCGVYAPISKTWDWHALSPLITDQCVILGDFNIDLNQRSDAKAAEGLLKWSDLVKVVPVLPDENTSLRSGRVIDYALARGVSIELQTVIDNTTSDHKPLLGTLCEENSENTLASRTHWDVFNTFLALTLEFWEDQYGISTTDEYYGNFISLLDGLKSRCTTYFPHRKYRSAIPKELRMSLSLARALSFRQKRTGDVRLKQNIKELRRVNRLALLRIRTNQLSNSLNERCSGSNSGNVFWSRVRRNFKLNEPIKAFIDEKDRVIRDSEGMLDLAAIHFENTFKESVVYRPHPYIDSPEIVWDNYNEEIPSITMGELRKTITKMKKKQSCDAHGILSAMLKFLPTGYLGLMLKIFNESLKSCTGPSQWKLVKMRLLTKKDTICLVSDTRPISLLDTFLKVFERLFLIRFQKVLENRGLLHDSQSGFRSNFRLQSRVALVLDQIASQRSNSAPVATVFIDFKQAFDMLWWDGCVGKLRRLGIPKAYVDWIESWLKDRQGFIEMNGSRSRLFPIRKGGPQGSCLSPVIFITYHCDMWKYIENSLPNFYADDLACVVGGRMGEKFTIQCLDVESKLKKLFEYLEFYAALSIQPINYEKTEWLWTARAIGRPKFEVQMGENKLQLVNSYRYLGYHISSRLGWSKMIAVYKLKIRQRVGILRNIHIFGMSSPNLRKILFDSYVRPLFSWLYSIFPLMTENQRDDLSHFYISCLKRTLGLWHWCDTLFATLTGEKFLENHVVSYWNRYIQHLNNSTDGLLLGEQVNLSIFRSLWLDKEMSLPRMYRSKRFVSNSSTVQRCLRWLEQNGEDATPHIPESDLITLKSWPDSFL